MPSVDRALCEEEMELLENLVRRLAQDAQARAVFLMEKNGQQIAAAGAIEGLDPASLAALPAENHPTTDSQLDGEREAPVLLPDGTQVHIHSSIVAKRAILCVVFDERSSLGLVRLRVRRASSAFDKIFDAIARKSGSGSANG